MKESRPVEVILEAVDRFGEDRLALAASWQKETAVLVDLVRRHAPAARIFTLDTGVLFDETYATWRAVEERYGITVESFRGDWVPGLWATDPDRCCFLRKVEPLERALDDADCWISGVRRDQSPDRARTEELDWDDRHGLWKANPLATWSEQRRLGVHRAPRPAVQPAARPGLLLDRLHALHAAGRGARGPLGRAREDRMRAARAGLALTHLEALEAEAIHVIREVAAELERPVLLFSGGKDSIVLAHLAAQGVPAGPRPVRADARRHGPQLPRGARVPRPLRRRARHAR